MTSVIKSYCFIIFRRIKPFNDNHVRVCVLAVYNKAQAQFNVTEQKQIRGQHHTAE